MLIKFSAMFARKESSFAINALLAFRKGITLKVVLFRKKIVTFLIRCSELNVFVGEKIFLIDIDL